VTASGLTPEQARRVASIWGPAEMLYRLVWNSTEGNFEAVAAIDEQRGMAERAYLAGLDEGRASVERAGYRLVAQCGYARVFANEDGTCTDHTCVLDVDHAKSPLMHVCARCGTKYLSGPRDRRVPTAPPEAQS
jgi:hypothetical protein